MAKQGIKILVICIVLVFVGGVISFVNAFVGNPISKAIATSKIKAYVSEQYRGMEVELSKARYNFKDSGYMINVKSKSSMDTHFYVSYADGKIRDNYKNDVLGGWTTFQRLEEEYRNLVEPLIEKNMPYEFDMIIATLDKEGLYSSGVLELDMEFDINNLPLKQYVTVYAYADELSWNNVAKLALELDQLMKANNLNIAEYNVILESKPVKEDEKINETLGVYDFPQEMLHQANLEQVMKEHFEQWEAAGDAKKNQEKNQEMN